MAGETQYPLGFEGLEEEFVAYLDGEADPVISRRLEELIARDEHARKRLRALERSYSALDALPAARASDRLASSTVEMIALDEDRERHAAQATIEQGQRGFWVAASFVLVAAASLGFAITARITGRENQRLLENLPVIEHLDEYRQVEDIQFLRKLSNGKQFDHRPQHGDTRF